MTSSAPSSRLVPIAEIARPHGVRGELRLKLFNEGSELIARGRKVMMVEAIAKPGASALVGALSAPRAEAVEKTIVAARPANGALLVRMNGVDDRDVAESLRGRLLCVRRDELPEPEEGEFYACDVEGARVELVSGDVIGEVTELISYPTCDALRVKLTDGKSIEVPLVDDYVAEVDADSHLVKLHHIDELG